jgi:hypothetical protein
VPENLLQRVEPAAVGPKFVSIPVRIIVDAEGGVRHIHVIRATNEQRKSIQDALRQWKFKPYRLDAQLRLRQAWCSGSRWCKIDLPAIASWDTGNASRTAPKCTFRGLHTVVFNP